jgi:hypothetical protein
VTLGCASFVPSHRDQGTASYDILELADLPATEHELLPEEKVTERKGISPKVPADPSEQADEPLAPQSRYWRLPPEECACRAAANAPIADLIEMEKELVASRESRKGPDQAQILQQTLLSLRATDIRNQVAGQALELYYKLVEVEAGRDAIRKSIQLVEKAMKDLAELRDRGLSIEVDSFDLKQQRLELIERQHELVLKSKEINRQLKLLLNALGIDPPIWPDLKVSVVFEHLDADSAVALGAETRADLTMLRLLSGAVDSSALSTARSALRQREGSLGNQSPTIRDMLQILSSKRGQRESRIRQRQLATLLSTQYKTVATEIRGGVAEVGARQGQIRVSKLKLDQRRQRLAELQQQQQAGGATAFDIFQERLEIVRVESELMKHVVAWKIAQVKLKKAQGILAEECGYGRDSLVTSPPVVMDCFDCTTDNRVTKPSRVVRRARTRPTSRNNVIQPQHITSSVLR